MARLRCTREQAQAEAIRLAEEFLLTIPNSSDYKFSHAVPDTTLPRGDSGKIPAVWLVIYTYHKDGGTWDGCDLCIRVNVQTKVTEWDLNSV